jgi:hypothetical protein
MKRLSVFLIVAVTTAVPAGCRMPSLRGGPCAATRRPVIAPWARHFGRQQPETVVVPAPAYGTYAPTCGTPMATAPVCGSPGVIVPGTTVYDSEVPLYDATPIPGAAIPTQPIPPGGVIGPETGLPTQ